MLKSFSGQGGFTPIIILVVTVVGIGLFTGVAFYFFNSTRTSGDIATLEVSTPSGLESTASGVVVVSSSPKAAATPVSGCSVQCQTLIDQKIAALKQDLLRTIQDQNAANNVTVATVPSSSPASVSSGSTPKEFYVYMGQGGSNSENDWTAITGSDVVFNAADYPGAKGFYFQANLVSDAPDRTTYARLVNTANGAGVPNSDINFTGLASTFKESGSMSMPSGKVTLAVQVHNLNVNLATVQNPRIRIAY